MDEVSSKSGEAPKEPSTGPPPPPINGKEAVASNSGSVTAPQRQQVHLRASVKQCKQLFATTCRIKLQRCDGPPPTSATDNAVATAPSSSNAPVESTTVAAVKVEKDTRSGPSGENEAPSTSRASRPVDLGIVKKEGGSNAADNSFKDRWKGKKGNLGLRSGPKDFAGIGLLPKVKKERSSCEDKRSGPTRAVVKVKKENDKDTANGFSKEVVRKLKRKSSAFCTVCKKTIRSNAYQKLHMRRHTGDKRYRCGTCGRSFKWPSSLSQHIKARDRKNGACPLERKPSGVWRPKGAWNCKICGKRMKTGASYLPHMRSHRGEKPFSCGDCGKSFVTNGELSVHKRFHNGVRPYSCVFCEKAFHQQGGLFNHLRVHTEEKPYFCKVKGCGASYRQLSSFQLHRRTAHYIFSK